MSRWLLATGEARFGLASVRWLMLCAAILALAPFEPDGGPRAAHAATFLAWLPPDWLSQPFLLAGARVWLLLSAVAWACWVGVPWTSWSAVAAFATCWALRVENASHNAHVFHAPFWVLTVHALWFHVRRDEIRHARDGRTLSGARVYPRWVPWLSVFSIGWFHTLAGIAKIRTSGWDWGTGTSLQLWVSLFGNPDAPLARPILASRTIASIAQNAALVIECASLVAIFGRWPRAIAGCALLAFYGGVLTVFPTFGFHLNALLIAWFLLPLDRWLRLDFELAAAQVSVLPAAMQLGQFVRSRSSSTSSPSA